MKSFERIPFTSSCVGHIRDSKRVGKGALDGKAPPSHGTNSVLDFLNEAKFTYSIVDHSPAFSSQAAAMHAHVSGNDVGKAVLVKLISDGAESEVVMCVLRAPDRIRLEEFACATGAQHAEILTEEDVQKRTKELGLTVEAGAVPALPQLYKCRCFMDRALAQDEVVYFNAGEYERLVAMSMHDFKTLVTPVVLSFAHEINSNIRDVQKVLNKSGCMNKCVVHYSVMRHDHTDNAPQTAQAVGLPGTAFIKAVTMLLDGKPALCVLCSHQDVDLQRLQQLCGASTVEPATDPELRAWFPSIQEATIPTIPPFAHLFDAKMPIYIDAEVGQWPDKSNAEVAFCAGSFTEAISMRFEDYMNAVKAFSQPVIGSFTTGGQGQENIREA